ncbi:hypothetical protein DH2020_022621 [Rehmannia glutinosa]|uniref:Uncharacterized protein n=1 Tax=Rehmannia glutinosa TaxID=99300 RepID=A0ABR0W3N3_REHGL
MADETVMYGESSDDRTVEIAGDEASPGITQKISDLEQENSTIIRKNKEYRQRIGELEASIETLRAENSDLKKQVSEARSESKSLGVVAARAEALETEVSRLENDLVSAMSDLQVSNAELSDLKRGLEGMKVSEKEKDVKLEAVQMEKSLLVVRVEKLAGIESSLRDELERKEKEIQGLKNNVEELEAVVGNSKTSEEMKSELESTIEKMKAQISSLMSSLDEKEKVITGFETKGRAVLDAVNGDINGDGKKGLIGRVKQMDWVVLGGSTIAAVSVMGVACYIHAARKH